MANCTWVDPESQLGHNLHLTKRTCLLDQTGDTSTYTLRGGDEDSSSNGGDSSCGDGNCEAGGKYNNCVSTFLDRNSYNWYAYQNNCAVALSIYVCGRTRGGCFGQDPVAPGKHWNTGYSKGEIDGMGGVWNYVCAAGFVPEKANGSPVDGADELFRCKKQ